MFSPFKGKVIPIEVKSGKTGTLKSLHIFMASTNHQMAIRFYAGPIQIDKVETGGLSYHLLSLPYFLASKLEKYLEWFESELGAG